VPSIFDFEVKRDATFSVVPSTKSAINAHPRDFKIMSLFFLID
jgi:hypothetical protein